MARQKKARTAGTLFDKIDENDDGELSREEFVGAAPAYFSITEEKAKSC